MTDCCCEITPPHPLPCADEAHAALAVLGHDGWLYLAQIRHEPQGEDQLRLDVCELASQRWHNLLDTALDPRPLSGLSPEAHCQLAFASDDTGVRLHLTARSPRGCWHWEQTAGADVRAPLTLCSTPPAPSLSTRLECSELLHHPGGSIGVVRDPAASWRISALLDLENQVNDAPRDWLDRVDPALRARVTQAAIQDSRLYLAARGDDDGFSLWRCPLEPEHPHWQPVLERGAERYVHNRDIFALASPGEALYLATGTSPDRRHPESAFFDYQGFEILRMTHTGGWELISGVPRVSAQGLKLPLSVLGPGLGAGKRREWQLLHAQGGHLILGASDEEGLRLWHSCDGETWEALAQQGLEQIQTVVRCRVSVCAALEAVLVLDTLELDEQAQTRIWRLDLSALDCQCA